MVDEDFARASSCVSREGNENFVISSDDVILCSGVFHRGLGMLIENIERKVFSVWFHIPCR